MEHLGHGFDDQPVQRCAVRLGGGRRLLAHFLNQHAHVLGAVGLLGTGLQLVEYGHQLVGGSLPVGGHLAILTEVARIGQIAGGLGQRSRPLVAVHGADLVGPPAQFGLGDLDGTQAASAARTPCPSRAAFALGVLCRTTLAFLPEDAGLLGTARFGNAVAQFRQHAAGDQLAVDVLVGLDQFDRQFGLEQVQQERSGTGILPLRLSLVCGEDLAQHLEDDVRRDRVFVFGKPVLAQQRAEAGTQAIGQFLVHAAAGTGRNAGDQQLVAHGVVVDETQCGRFVAQQDGLRHAVRAIGRDAGTALPVAGAGGFELLLDAGLAVAQQVERGVERVLPLPGGFEHDLLDQLVHHGDVGVAEAPAQRKEDGLANIPQDFQVSGFDLGTGGWHRGAPGYGLEGSGASGKVLGPGRWQTFSEAPWGVSPVRLPVLPAGPAGDSPAGNPGCHWQWGVFCCHDTTCPVSGNSLPRENASLCTKIRRLPSIRLTAADCRSAVRRAGHVMAVMRGASCPGLRPAGGQSFPRNAAAWRSPADCCGRGACDARASGRFRSRECA